MQKYKENIVDNIKFSYNCVIKKFKRIKIMYNF